MTSLLRSVVAIIVGANALTPAYTQSFFLSCPSSPSAMVIAHAVPPPVTLTFRRPAPHRTTLWSELQRYWLSIRPTPPAYETAVPGAMTIFLLNEVPFVRSWGENSEEREEILFRRVLQPILFVGLFIWTLTPSFPIVGTHLVEALIASFITSVVLQGFLFSAAHFELTDFWSGFLRRWIAGMYFGAITPFGGAEHALFLHRMNNLNHYRKIPILRRFNSRTQVNNQRFESLPRGERWLASGAFPWSIRPDDNRLIATLAHLLLIRFWKETRSKFSKNGPRQRADIANRAFQKLIDLPDLGAVVQLLFHPHDHTFHTDDEKIALHRLLLSLRDPQLQPFFKMDESLIGLTVQHAQRLLLTTPWVAAWEECYQLIRRVQKNPVSPDRIRQALMRFAEAYPELTPLIAFELTSIYLRISQIDPRRADILRVELRPFTMPAITANQERIHFLRQAA